MPCGARLILAFIACLSPVPAPSGAALPPPLRADAAPPATGGTLRAHGRISGVCPGVVLVAWFNADGDLLAQTRASGGRWSLGPVAGVPASIHWGCTTAGGVVPPEHVVVAGFDEVPLQSSVLVLPTAE